MIYKKNKQNTDLIKFLSNAQNIISILLITINYFLFYIDVNTAITSKNIHENFRKYYQEVNKPIEQPIESLEDTLVPFFDKLFHYLEKIYATPNNNYFNNHTLLTDHINELFNNNADNQLYYKNLIKIIYLTINTLRLFNELIINLPHNPNSISIQEKYMTIVEQIIHQILYHNFDYYYIHIKDLENQISVYKNHSS